MLTPGPCWRKIILSTNYPLFNFTLSPSRHPPSLVGTHILLSNERKDGQLNKWSPATAMISATIKFAIATGRLEDRSDESDEDIGEEDNGMDEEDMA